MEQLRWAIMGPGRIAHRWMNGAMQVRDMKVTAVAGRTKQNVDSFAERYHIEHRFYSYEAIAESKEIDCVYVAVPHAFHKELAMLAMRSGKHVLVEKPISISERDAAEMIACAKEHGVFLMEAVWTRFFPAIETLTKLLAGGELGQVRAVHAAFSFRAPVDHASRLFDPRQGGGGLLDVGVYPLNLADIIFDREPLELVGLAAIDSDEDHILVDEQCSFIARYAGGALAVMSAGVRTDLPQEAAVYTTEAAIRLPSFWKPTTLEIVKDGKLVDQLSFPVEQCNTGYRDEGFQYEISHMCKCVLAGMKESPVMTHQKTLSIMRQCDALREQWNRK